MAQRLVLPVIHFLNRSTAVDQAAVAFSCGADGVFLISHHGAGTDELIAVGQAIKAQHADKLVGINFLGKDAYESLLEVASAKLDMVWTDDPGVSSKGITDDGNWCKSALMREGAKWPLFFGSVAFKYQRTEPHPGVAAKLAADAGMLPTTSGEATGSAPGLGKARDMSQALNGGPLAIASGMTPENVAEFLPYFTHYLVATGVSTDMFHFDPSRLKAFVDIVKNG